MIRYQKPDSYSSPTCFGIRYELLICCFLIAATLLAYGNVGTFNFVRYDDTEYVVRNPHVQAGITLDGIAWAFASTHASNWHPLTWLSHMLDVQFWGMNPGGHHLTSLLFHVVNTLLLFFVFNRMTRCLWQSGVMAALFALHPLHVESVAWVAERKDLLSTFFWLLTMHYYFKYTENPGIRQYAPVLLVFILGLMAKPMLVTLPFVLLLLDFWPLNRMSRFSLPKLIWEKIPLFIAAGLSSAATFIVQQRSGAMSSLDVYPLSVRMANALLAYMDYIRNLVWPVRLAVLYPHPGMPPLGQVVWAGVLLAGISWLIIRNWKQQPYLLVGWLWYLGTLVPVIGLVQVGQQALADRYTYVPLIGLFIIGAWGIPDLLARSRHRIFTLSILALAVFPLLTMTTRLQTGYWRNSITLFGHALEVTADNQVAHNNLGNALAARGRLNEALIHFSAAIQIQPNNPISLNNMGAALMLKNENEKALRLFEKVLKIRPDHPEALKNLERVKAKLGVQNGNEATGF